MPVPLVEPLIGGLFMGIAIGFLMLYQGNYFNPGIVMGRGLFKPYEAETSMRSIISVGMILCGYFLPRLGPGFRESVFEYERVYKGIPLWYLCVGSLLIGYGSQLGYGCISSHGIAGVVSRQKRSFLWMVLMLAAAAATANLSPYSQLIASRNVVESGGEWGHFSLPMMDWWIALSFLLTLFVLDMCAIHTMEKFAAEHLLSLTVGLMYGMATGMAGVNRPSRMLSGLTAESVDTFDPSVYVAGGAGIVGAGLCFLVAFRYFERPLMQFMRFNTPRTDRVNVDLLFGAIIFGVGWGMTGQTPVTLCLSIVHSNPKALLMVITGIGGMALRTGFTGVLELEEDDETKQA